MCFAYPFADGPSKPPDQDREARENRSEFRHCFAVPAQDVGRFRKKPMREKRRPIRSRLRPVPSVGRRGRRGLADEHDAIDRRCIATKSRRVARPTYGVRGARGLCRWRAQSRLRQSCRPWRGDLAGYIQNILNHQCDTCRLRRFDNWYHHIVDTRQLGLPIVRLVKPVLHTNG